MLHGHDLEATLQSVKQSPQQGFFIGPPPQKAGINGQFYRFAGLAASPFNAHPGANPAQTRTPTNQIKQSLRPKAAPPKALHAKPF